VRLKLAMGPWWVQGLVHGLLFGFLMTLFFRLDEDSWFPALVSGPISGVFFGVAMGLTMSRINRRMLLGLEVLTSAELRTVARAAARGPAPDDVRLREAAEGLVRRRRDEMLRTRRWSLVLFSALPVLYVLLAITQKQWWWWLAAMVFFIFLAYLLTTPGRVKRRLAVLSPREVEPR
jgi:hypothetical protein